MLRFLLSALVLVAANEASSLAQDHGDSLGTPPSAEGAQRVEPTEPDVVSPNSPIPPPPPDRAPPSSYATPSSEGGYGNLRSLRGALGSEARVSSRIATRIRVLDGDFATLAARGGSAIVDGVLSIVTGGLVVALGFVANDDLISPYLFLYGGAGVGRGIVQLAFTPDPSDPAVEFAHMPMATEAQVMARLAYGEHALESLAHRTRLARLLDASLNIAVGLAVIPVYLGPQDFKVEDHFDYFILIGAGISVISGVIHLLTRSEAERRWSAYDKLRRRLEREEHRAPHARLHFDVGIAPLPAGGALALSARF